MANEYIVPFVCRCCPGRVSFREVCFRSHLVHTSPCMSNRGVAIKEIDSRKGRGLFAVEDHSAKTVVLEVSADIAVLYTPHNRHLCGTCFQPVAVAEEGAEGSDRIPGTRCSQCHNFVLCMACSSANEKAWDIHSVACRWFCMLPQHVREGDTDYLRFLLEYSARVQSGDTRLLMALSDLCTNEESQAVDVADFCRGYSKLVSAQFAKEGLVIDQAQLHRLLLQTKSNSIGFPFEANQTLGWALQEDVCMMNHSCEPNCAVQPAGSSGKIRVVALTDIPRDAELTISYVDLETFPDVVQRTRHLLERYRFLCCCSRCIRERQAGAA